MERRRPVVAAILLREGIFTDELGCGGRKVVQEVLLVVSYGEFVGGKQSRDYTDWKFADEKKTASC
jgi:hypothetical protein